MSGAEYGGDEVGAIVLDVGGYSTRVGYAGEDSPKADFPTIVGVAPSKSDDDVMETSTIRDDANAINTSAIGEGDKLDYVVGTNYVTPAREGLELISPMQDGMIENWDLFEHLIDHVYKKVIKSERIYHPLLMTECAWNTKAKRARLTEIMFEKYELPAFYLAKNAVLSTFANARSTALVIDSGWEQTSVVPVHDGYALTQAIVRTPYAGRYISRTVRKLMEEKSIELVPATHIAEKQMVKERQKPIYTLRKLPKLTQSYKEFMVDQLVTDFKTVVCQISEEKYEADELRTLPTIEYEFPTGYRNSFGVERFEICESMFNNDEYMESMILESHQLISEVAISASNACDTDIRPSLLSSLVVVGGNSLLKGFTDRLISEIRLKSSMSKVHKSITNNTTVERRFSAWIGGSILASLGTFQQMWISKAEYEEHGKLCVEKKCP